MPARTREPKQVSAPVRSGVDRDLPALMEQPRQPWIGRLRLVVVPVIAVLAIVLVIYVLEDKPAPDLAPDSEQSAAVASGSAQPVQVTASREELATTPAPRIGFSAPAFNLTDLEGKPVKLSDFRGQAVFLNYFATWCPPCRAEMPDILATYEENKASGVVVVGVDLQEDAPTVAAYANTVGLTFPIVLDKSGRVAALYRINALPTSFFIDKDGIIRDMQIGAMSKSLMSNKLKKAMLQ